MYNTALQPCQVADIQYFARMAELVDALDSKSSFRKEVRVRPPLRVPFYFYGNHTQRTGVRYARPAGYN